jgi:MFS superfamily sulfate permease-like transporter
MRGGDTDQPTIAAGILAQLRGATRRTLAGDVVAGLTVAALVLPLSMGLAVTAGLPPEHGLYASMLPMLVFALLASSRQTMIGPDASVTAMVVAAVLPLSDGDHVRHEALTAALAIAAGAICAIAALVGMGRLASLLREAALTGYLAGLAVVVAVAQLPRVSGTGPLDTERTPAQVIEWIAEWSTWNWPSLALAAGTLAFVLVARARRPALPWMLFAVTVAAIVTAWLDLTDAGVAVVGTLPDGLPIPQLPDVRRRDVLELLPTAFAIMVVTFADTMATATAFAARNGYAIRPGRDLAALGLADIASGLSGGPPVSASGARTAAAESSGGTSQLTGIVAALVIAIVLVGAGDVLAALPQPALGAVVIAAVVPMVDVQSLGRLWRLDRPELTLAVIVMAAVVLIGVLEGIAVAFVASIARRLWLSRRVGRS